ncbi:MAG: energy-coupled thiamine transporter ThiT [Lachnospiraceae bacterium]|nr:energy-coupled thiamine transporter ThiT [Lachnospiraceae bacterium]MBP5471402.1 energy-coupled thiamine transporter ThiT [Lachnospiraceae bacterium]MBP5702413.1 energy-coupled thiamine transporter ThiT [Lachnospiraceae bacterium]
MFWNAEDGYYVMGAGGYVVLVAALLIALVLIGVFRGRKKDAKSKFSVKTVTFAGVSIALAFVLSFVKLYHLPWGGSVTLLSMFFVAFVGYLYGPGVGFAAAFVYSILQFIQGGGGSYMLSPLQVMCDYFLAFTALGVSGFFKGKKNGLIIGYIIAVICRGAFHALGGYLFWMDYMPEDFFAPAVYPILYNYAYLIPEMILTVIVIILPPVRKAIERVRNMADQM